MTSGSKSEDGALSKWEKRLQDNPVSRLPSDFARPSLLEFSEAEYSATVDSNALTSLRRLAVSHGTTPIVVLLTSFFLIVHRITGDDDIRIGTNDSAQWAFPIHCQLSASETFSSLLYKVHNVISPSRPPHPLPFQEFAKVSRSIRNILLMRFSCRISVLHFQGSVLQSQHYFIWDSTVLLKNRIQNWASQERLQKSSLSSFFPNLPLLPPLKRSGPCISGPYTIRCYFWKKESLACLSN